jgi:hypothetical protein
MTIDELRKLNDDDNYNATWEKLQKLYNGHTVPYIHYDNAEDNIDFWSKILDSVVDEEIKQMLFVMISELSWYSSLDIDGYTEEALKEICKADIDGRLIISPFAIGDKIVTSDDPYPMQVSEIIYNKSGIHINAKRYERVTRYDYNEHNLDEKTLKKYMLSSIEDNDFCKHIVYEDW